MKKLNVLVPSVLALFVASAAHAGATFDTPQGKLSIGGDVEYDVTANSYQEGNHADATDSQFSSGRILLDINGERALANGNFAAFKLNPMWGQQGNDKGADDAWFSFGVKNDWAFKIGHFEAYDLSPAGQDTYVADDHMNLYRAKDGRGRNSSSYADGTPAGGHILLSKEVGQWHYELGTQFGADGDSAIGLYEDPTTPAADVAKNKDPLLARPVVAWTGDTVTVAVGAEINLISDAYVTNDAARESLSDWTGYAATTTIKATDDLSFSLRGAYRSADEFDQYTVGPGVQYQNFYIAYLYGATNPDGSDNNTTNHLTYASYKIPGVMGLDNFDMYLGASYGRTKTDGDAEADKDYGARVRFKYFF